MTASRAGIEGRFSLVERPLLAVRRHPIRRKADHQSQTRRDIEPGFLRYADPPASGRGLGLCRWGRLCAAEERRVAGPRAQRAS